MNGIVWKLLRRVNNMRMKFLSVLRLDRYDGRWGGSRFFSCANNDDENLTENQLIARANAELGIRGEKIAKKFLKKKGYRFLCANFNVQGQGEIDLIFFDGNSVVFVEVKARHDERFVPAEKVVHFGKQKKLYIAAKHFVKRNKLYDRPLRFDVVIVIDSEEVEVRHYENAFRPGKR